MASLPHSAMPPPRDDDGPALDPVHHAASGAARRRLATRAPLKHTLSSQDALSGDPSRAAMASCAAGIIQGCLLLPMNTVQTQMQTRGKSIPATLRSLFEGGTLSGVHNLYRALLPTVGMLGARQGLKFGSGAVYKQRLPTTWPEPARDACAGGLSALTSTTLLFPLDTLKTRWQMGMPGPSAGQAYNGFRPAASYSVFGMALWLVSRNALERNIPDPPSGSALAYWKHFFCGGMVRRHASQKVGSGARQPRGPPPRGGRGGAPGPALSRGVSGGLAFSLCFLAFSLTTSDGRMRARASQAGVMVQVPTFPFDTLKKCAGRVRLWPCRARDRLAFRLGAHRQKRPTHLPPAHASTHSGGCRRPTIRGRSSPRRACS